MRHLKELDQNGIPYKRSASVSKNAVRCEEERTNNRE